MRSTLRTVVALAAAIALLAAACGDDTDDDGNDDADVFPLLGTTGAVPDNLALAVKLDNTEGGRPQAGLTQADIVYEELVEGGLTRLMAVYQSQDPDTVGPVRSARSTDLALLAEYDRPLFAWSGANPTVAGLVAEAEIIDVGFAEVPDGYERADSRAAPYNLFASPATLRAEDGGEADVGPPAPLFDYRAPGAALSGPGVEDSPGIRLSGSGLSTVIEWEWDDSDGVWQRTQDGSAHVDEDGDRITAANVVVRVTSYEDTGTRDATGALVPEAVIEGGGDVLLLSGGQAQPGTWEVTADGSAFYRDTDGDALQLAPGPTWIEVLPADPQRLG